MNFKRRKILQASSHEFRPNSGFTLMEIVVATTIFAFVVLIMLSLFNYTLKINRRGEALRQASQGMRNFVESLAKEIRNGEVDYGLNASHDGGRGTTVGPCVSGVVNADYYGDLANQNKSNFLSLVNSDGILQCVFFGDGTTTYAGTGVYTNPTGGSLVIQKENGTPQLLNPPNFKVEEMVFYVRPTCDPYTINTNPGNPGSGCDSYSNDYPKIQPVVSMFFKFLISLPTGKRQTIYYQTSVSSNKYDIPQ